MRGVSNPCKIMRPVSHPTAYHPPVHPSTAAGAPVLLPSPRPKGPQGAVLSGTSAQHRSDGTLSKEWGRKERRGSGAHRPSGCMRWGGRGGGISVPMGGSLSATQDGMQSILRFVTNRRAPCRARGCLHPFPGLHTSRERGNNRQSKTPVEAERSISSPPHLKHPPGGKRRGEPHWQRPCPPFPRPLRSGEERDPPLPAPPRRNSRTRGPVPVGGFPTRAAPAVHPTEGGGGGRGTRGAARGLPHRSFCSRHRRGGGGGGTGFHPETNSDSPPAPPRGTHPCAPTARGGGTGTPRCGAAPSARREKRGKSLRGTKNYLRFIYLLLFPPLPPFPLSVFNALGGRKTKKAAARTDPAGNPRPAPRSSAATGTGAAAARHLRCGGAAAAARRDGGARGGTEAPALLRAAPRPAAAPRPPRQLQEPSAPAPRARTGGEGGGGGW